ncbi:MAG: hypothetical protein F6K18_15910 [Okeania sp. SIO2C2]|uniref:class I SAM-dependent methyltransferase n=1 Tax=Okeania sp. SIO2C2 TaxID=2607787 RepID=UPI0013BBF376|nr:hypothetical protein [Okeania sp. SIO2C2]NEP88195.1 hypothetical protein [Okeania sp. SIO2C2]
MNLSTKNNISRNNPNHPNGIKKVQVGCGPHNIMADWWNVDIRPFPGIDQVMDVTKPWPFNGLEYVYGEHFLEHLSLEGAIAFLNNVWKSLKPGGVIRLSTPSLEWVLSTHFNLSETNPQKRIDSTFSMNRAFHGWGHQFLYSKDFLQSLLNNLGWQKVIFCEYGKSEHSSLKSIERHGKYRVDNGYPNIWIVEGTRGEGRSESSILSYQKLLDKSYVSYVRSGH